MKCNIGHMYTRLVKERVASKGGKVLGPVQHGQNTHMTEDVRFASDACSHGVRCKSGHTHLIQKSVASQSSKVLGPVQHRRNPHMTEDLGHKAWVIQHLPKQSPAHRPKLHHILRFMQPARGYKSSCDLASALLVALPEVHLICGLEGE